MTKLTRGDVLKLAKLSKLQLSEQEVAEYIRELSRILEYVEKLQSVEIKDIEPTHQVTGLTNVMRADEQVDYGISREDLLKNVPAIKDGQIKVKRVL